MSNKRSSGQMARPIFLHQLLLKMTGLNTTMHGCHSTFRDRCSENRINDTVVWDNSIIAIGYQWVLVSPTGIEPVLQS